MGDRDGHNEGNRFSESRAERLVGINYRKVQPSKISPALLSCVCARARTRLREIASLKYENYCPLLRSVSLAMCVTPAFFGDSFSLTLTLCLSFILELSFFLSAAGTSPRSKRELTRVSLPRSRMCAPFISIFYLTEDKISLQFVNQFANKKKQTEKKRAFQYLPFLPSSRGECVRAFVHASARACDFFAWPHMRFSDL